MAELDHDAIKEKIVAILKASATLFDADDLTKIRAIEVGHPEGNPMDPEMMDHIFVTNASPFETIRNDGRAVVSNAITALEHNFNYDIVVIVNASTAREAEEKLDDFQKIILELLEADVDLTGTGTSDVDVSFPVSIQLFRPTVAEGRAIQGRVITLRCMKVTN